MAQIDLESFLFGVLIGAVCYILVRSIYENWFKPDCAEHFGKQIVSEYGFSYDAGSQSFNSKDTGPKERAKARQALISVIPELSLVEVSATGVLKDADLILFLADWNKDHLIERKNYVIAFVRNVQFRKAVKYLLAGKPFASDSDKKVVIDVLSTMMPINSSATSADVRRALQIILEADE